VVIFDNLTRSCHSDFMIKPSFFARFTGTRKSLEKSSPRLVDAYRTAKRPGIDYGSHLGTKRAAFERAVDIGTRNCILARNRAQHDEEYTQLVKDYGHENGVSTRTLDALNYCLYWWRANISRYTLNIENGLRIADDASHEGDWAHEALDSYLLTTKKTQKLSVLFYKNLAEDKGSESYVIVDPGAATHKASVDIDICLITSSAESNVLAYMSTLQQSDHFLGKYILTHDEHTRFGPEKIMRLIPLNVGRLTALLQ